MTRPDFMAEAQNLRDELIERRRDLHRYPELAFEEVRTAGIVARELSMLGLEVRTGVGKTGVVGLLAGDHPGPTVLVRADMDALPIAEDNNTDYVSTISGKMHACGHDGHTSVALAVARLMAQHRRLLAGRVLFVFQPAEEIGQGAKAMISDGVLDNPRPDVVLGLHLWNSLPLGQLGVADGPIMGACDDLSISITGKGGHGAFPDLAVDPVVCGSQIVSALQTIVSRNLNPLQSAVISVTRFQAGQAFNVIPHTAELAGTIRTLNPQVREYVKGRVEEIATAIGQAMGCQVDVRIDNVTAPVVNDAEVSARVRRAFSQVVDSSTFVMNERTMAAEDVGLLMRDIPGMYFFVGAANAAAGLDYGHHHPRFDFDENVLPLACGLLAAAVAEYLIPPH